MVVSRTLVLVLNDEDNQNLNETSPFIPGSASTPGPGGEAITMQTRSHEQSGLPEASYTETSFGGRRNITDEEIERRLNYLGNP